MRGSRGSFRLRKASSFSSKLVYLQFTYYLVYNSEMIRPGQETRWKARIYLSFTDFDWLCFVSFCSGYVRANIRWWMRQRYVPYSTTCLKSQCFLRFMLHINLRESAAPFFSQSEVLCNCRTDSGVRTMTRKLYRVVISGWSTYRIGWNWIAYCCTRTCTHTHTPAPAPA